MAYPVSEVSILSSSDVDAALTHAAIINGLNVNRVDPHAADSGLKAAGGGLRLWE